MNATTPAKVQTSWLSQWLYTSGVIVGIFLLLGAWARFGGPIYDDLFPKYEYVYHQELVPTLMAGEYMLKMKTYGYELERSFEQGAERNLQLMVFKKKVRIYRY